MIKRWFPMVLMAACAVAQAQAVREAPPSGQFCRGKDRVEYAIGKDEVTLLHGQNEYRGPTAYSWFGKNKPPKGFVVAFLIGAGKEALLYEDRLEWRNQTWKPCPAPKN